MAACQPASLALPKTRALTTLSSHRVMTAFWGHEHMVRWQQSTKVAGIRVKKTTLSGQGPTMTAKIATLTCLMTKAIKTLRSLSPSKSLSLLPSGKRSHMSNLNATLLKMSLYTPSSKLSLWVKNVMSSPGRTLKTVSSSRRNPRKQK